MTEGASDLGTDNEDPTRTPEATASGGGLATGVVGVYPAQGSACCGGGGRYPALPGGAVDAGPPAPGPHGSTGGAAGQVSAGGAEEDATQGSEAGPAEGRAARVA
eukprot:7257829-Alexandrium_andersonii.AAC.1